MIDYLKKIGRKALFLREPGGIKISEKIRKILLDAKNDAMTPECEMLLYMAARAEVVNKLIAPALIAGKIVVCDRFMDSTIAYQGYGLGMDIDFIRQVGNFVTAGVNPDLTILLDVPIKKGLGYRAGNKDRIEQRSLQYHTRVRRGYFKLAGLEPKRIKVVKVHQDFAVTQDRIRDLVINII